MGKNYIEEATIKYNINNGERFTFNDFEHVCFINEFYELECETLGTGQRDALLLGIMLGKRIPVKIKPKTLMQQLKEQGYGWLVNLNGAVTKIEITSSLYCENWLYQNHLYLTKTEAERESYRRKLEFEMQEWARENECLSTSSPHLDCQIFKMFNVYVRTHDDMLKAKGIFSNFFVKYYNWEE